MREVSRICPDAVPRRISRVDKGEEAEEGEEIGAQETESIIAPFRRLRGFAFRAEEEEGSPEGNGPM